MHLPAPGDRPAQRICVVGAGVSGLGAAWTLLRHPDRFDVEVFELGGCIGGDARTIDIPQDDGPPVAVDISVTAFIASVYPNFVELMRACQVSPVPTQFNFAVYYGTEIYAHDLSTPLRERLAADISRFQALLRFLSRFNVLNRRPSLLVAAMNPFNYISMGRMLDLWRVSQDFRYQALKPMFVNFVLASNVFDLPASLFSRYMEFFDIEHATPMTTWNGGTRRIYQRMTEGFADRVHLERGVVRIERDDAGVTVCDTSGVQHRFDQVILACNADHALAILAKPTFLERQILGRVRYDDTLHRAAIVHTDESVLPDDQVNCLRTRSNVIRHHGSRPDNYQITYLMHNQQPWAKTADRPCLVTYNAVDHIDPSKIVARTGFRHVVNDVFHTVVLLNLFRCLQGRRHTWHCGTHTTVNSQEHGLVSGLTVARRLGADHLFPHNPEAVAWFNFYGRLMHGRSFRKARPW